MPPLRPPPPCRRPRAPPPGPRRSVPRCAVRSPRVVGRSTATPIGRRCKACRRHGISLMRLLIGLPRPGAELGDRAFAAGQLRTFAIDLVFPDRDVLFDLLAEVTGEAKAHPRHLTGLRVGLDEER